MKLSFIAMLRREIFYRSDYVSLNFVEIETFGKTKKCSEARAISSSCTNSFQNCKGSVLSAIRKGATVLTVVNSNTEIKEPYVWIQRKYQYLVNKRLQLPEHGQIFKTILQRSWVHFQNAVLTWPLKTLWPQAKWFMGFAFAKPCPSTFRDRRKTLCGS